MPMQMNPPKKEPKVVFSSWSITLVQVITFQRLNTDDVGIVLTLLTILGSASYWEMCGTRKLINTSELKLLICSCISQNYHQ